MLFLLAPAALGAPILDTYRPSPSAMTASIDGLEAASVGDVDLAAWSDYGVNPWLDAAGVGVTSRATAGIGVGVHLGRGFLLEAALPMVLAETGVHPGTGAAPVGTALASARLRARAMRQVSDHFAVGVALRAETPSLEFTEVDPRFRVGPELVVVAQARPLSFGASAGAYWGALDLRSGFAFHLHERFDLTVEGIATGPADGLGVEARLGGRVDLGGGLSIELGGGYGVVTAPGIPIARAYGGLRVAPRKAVAPAVTPVVVPVAVTPPVPRQPVATPPSTVAPPVTPPVAPPPAPVTALAQPLQIAVSFNGNRFTTSSVAALDSLALLLQEAGNTRVRLEVHMEPDARIADDFAESQTRADLIRDAMMARGIQGWRVEAMGFGAGATGKDVVDVIVVE